MSNEASPPQIFNSDGSLNEGNLSKHYGLGAEDAMQQVRFGEYTGTVADMLADGRCPVGGRIRTAFETTGIDGVLEQFGALNIMDPNFKVEISEVTVERARSEAGDIKKNKIFPQVQTT